MFLDSRENMILKALLLLLVPASFFSFMLFLKKEGDQATSVQTAICRTLSKAWTITKNCNRQSFTHDCSRSLNRTRVKSSTYLKFLKHRKRYWQSNMTFGWKGSRFFLLVIPSLTVLFCEFLIYYMVQVQVSLAILYNKIEIYSSTL